jgi:2-hydroxymuconate-semialdehyde hydrolase
MRSDQQISLSITNFIRSELIYENDQDFDDHTNLIERGIVDSMSVVRLIGFIEEEYGIRVPDEDIVPERFSSLCRIVTFIAERSIADMHNKPA